MLLSVVIITWNARRDVKNCLDSVLESTASRAKEIYVIDNGSTDDTLSILQSYSDRINLICLEKNRGIAVARNIGLKAAKGEYIWILDIDTVVNKEAVDSMITYLDSHPECGLCACRIQSGDGEIQDSCRQLPYPRHKMRNLIMSKINNFPFLKKLHHHIQGQNEKQFYHHALREKIPFEVEYVIGACQLFRKTILNEVGFLDEKIFYGPEDADFCLRIYQNGYQIVCLPEYHIIHHYNRISNKKLFSWITFLHLKGLFYFYFKHHLLFSNPYKERHG